MQRNNSKPSSVQIRIWPFYRLEHLLDLHGQTATKYGLTRSAKQLHFDFQRVVIELVKLAQSTYAAAEFETQTRDRIELMACFTELLSTRVDDAKRYGRFNLRPFKPDRDSFDWCEPHPLPAANFDQTSLRACSC